MKHPVFLSFMVSSFLIVINCQNQENKKISTDNLIYEITLKDLKMKKPVGGLVGYLCIEKPTEELLKDSKFFEETQTFYDKNNTGIYEVIVPGKLKEVKIAAPIPSEKKKLEFKFYLIFEDRSTKTFYGVSNPCFIEESLEVPQADKERKLQKKDCSIQYY